MMKAHEREMIQWGKLLFERRLISGWGGNMSCRLRKERLLITGQHAPLGFLSSKDLVEIDHLGHPVRKGRQPSSETTLHLAVYEGTEARAVIHAHPPLVLAFSLKHLSFIPLSYEEKYTIGEVAILPQETPTVTDTKRVVAELKLRPIVILQGHGTVAVGKDLKEAFLLTDLLEEAVRCHFFKDDRNAEEPEGRTEERDEERDEKSPLEAYDLFSREHLSALAESANRDSEFQKAAREANLTTTVALHMENGDLHWAVRFDNGRVASFEADAEGEFVISGKREWWEAIFKRRLDPFLAMQQGKLRLKRGEMWKLSRFFKPFQRAFTLWQKIPVR